MTTQAAIKANEPVPGTDSLFTAYSGGSCVIQGMHGYVTAFHTEGPHTVGAFFKVPPADRRVRPTHLPGRATA